MGCAGCSCNCYVKVAQNHTNNYVTPKPIMVIGESPSASEALSGNLMTSAGAKVLKETMELVGLPTCEIGQVCYTTAIKCALPKKKGSKIPKDAIENCRERLLWEIDIVKPKLILTCGATAFQVLTGRKDIKIKSEYGNVQEFDFIPNCKVIPIMNPGVLMHSPNEYKPFLTMLQLAANIYSGGDRFDAGETKWTVIKTAHHARELWKKMQFLDKTSNQLDVVTFDTETTGLDYRTAEFLVMGICFEKNHVYIIPRELRELAHNFTDNVPWKCYWQNGMYDKKVHWRREVANPQIDGDSMYMHYALDETSEHNLEYLAKTYLNAEPYKYKMNQNWKSVSLETYEEYFEALCERVAVDCDYTRQVVFKLQELHDKEENKTIKQMYNTLLIPAANFLSRVEQNGILVDEKPLRTMDVQYTKLLTQIRAEIAELAEPLWDPEQYVEDMGSKSSPKEFNPGSPKQMSWMVFKRLKLKPRIKKGISTSKEILKSIPNPPRLISKVLEFRTVQKEHSTYVIGLLDKMDSDDRVRTSFTIHVTATGRLSSKEPNVQNQPSAHGVGNVRKAFIAPEGRLLAEIDYQGAELRWLAFLSKCDVLGAVFKEGRNLHNETAKSLFGEHFTKQQKMRAKAVNFG